MNYGTLVDYSTQRSHGFLMNCDFSQGTVDPEVAMGSILTPRRSEAGPRALQGYLAYKKKTAGK